MPEFLQIASALREQMSATLSRSDVLKPLAWMLLIMAASTIGLAIYVPQFSWLLSCTSALFFLTATIYLFAYLYCLFRDPDALRSEKYSLNKLAIERGLYGDSSIGILEHADPHPDTTLALPGEAKRPSEGTT